MGEKTPENMEPVPPWVWDAAEVVAELEAETRRLQDAMRMLKQLPCAREDR